MHTGNDICVLGDSVMAGVIFDEDKRRYSLLRNGCLTAFTRDLGMRVHNLSRMGQTSPEAAEAFCGFLGSGKFAATVLIEIGGNDCDMDWRGIAAEPKGEHNPKVPLKQFRESVLGIIKAAKSRGMRPILSTLPPLDPARFLDWVSQGPEAKEKILSFLGDIGRIYRWQELYSSELSKIAGETGTGLVGIRERFLVNDNYEELICSDGIHPNARGHELMRGILTDYFGGLIGSRSALQTA